MSDNIVQETSVKDMIYLVRCFIHDTVPDKEKTEKMDLTALYKIAKKHMLTAIVCTALEQAGIKDNRFVQAKAKAIRKEIVLEQDRALLSERLEQEKIWYMPLKGMVMKAFYPSLGMRQMSDVDILFDSHYRNKVTAIMEELGFTGTDLGRGNHDVFKKKPVSNFEMHTLLFSDTSDNNFYEYYRDIKKRLVKDEENEYGYHFSHEDFYIYLIAHEYRHYCSSGTGLRSVLDTYVFWQKFGDTLDTAYITKETEKLHIADFERCNRQLALHLFGDGVLDKEAEKMLSYILSSGVYGTLSQKVTNDVQKNGGGRKGKIVFLFRRLFIPMETVRLYYPFFYRHKILLPFLFFIRIGRLFTVSRKKTRNTLRTLRHMKSD